MVEFAESVNGSVYRIVAASLLATSWMVAVAYPLIDLVYRRGKFDLADSELTSVYFFCFSLSLLFWAAQGLYARAFYAAGDTLTPMIAGTLITIASLPIYSQLYRTYSVLGLAIASNIGILANTLVAAWLLDRRKLVPLSELNWMELGKSALTAVAAGWISLTVSRLVPTGEGRKGDLLALALASITWAAAVAAGLFLLRSTLPNDLRRKPRTAYPAVAETQAEQTLDAGREP